MGCAGAHGCPALASLKGTHVVGIVLISHSADLARGCRDLAAQVAGDKVRIEAAGGGPNGDLGTTSDLISAAIDRAETGDGVLLLGDLGSSILVARHLLGQGTPAATARIADAPFVEGAVAAAVAAASGAPLDDVLRAAEDARDARKL
jgi:phosphoenolpyruvate---glycerone phosphotransferase subunit DhaM